MRRSHLAVPTKLWALLCVMVGVSLTSNAVLTCTLTLLGFTYLGFQRNWRLLRSFGVFYLLLAVLLYLIRFHGFHMAIFSEFYVLMLWNLSPVFLAAWDLITTPPGELAAFFSRIHMPTPVILGLLVVFRFFPTMRSEVKSVGRSMRNRGLTAPAQLVRHRRYPVSMCLSPYFCDACRLPTSWRFLPWPEARSIRASGAVIMGKDSERPTIFGLAFGRPQPPCFSL